MALQVVFYSLNDELYDTSVSVTLGPYQHVQMTYETLRDDTGQIIAAYVPEDGDWQLTERSQIPNSVWAENVPVGPHFSDFEITEVPS